MKKCLCLVLALMLCLMSLSAPAEEIRSASGYEFDFRFHLNTDSFPAAQRTRMKGYADLLEALSFHGSFLYEEEYRTIDFRLDLIPDAPDAEPVSLHFYGYPDNLMLSSSLFGEEAVLFSNISLMEFVLKIHEHLGLNLQYLVLLYPYVYENSFYWVALRWKKTFLKKAESRRVTAKKIREFAEYLEKSCIQWKNIENLIRAFCLSGEMEDTIRAEVYNLSTWLVEDITRGKPISIAVEPGSEIWSVSKKPFYTHTWSETEESIFTDLPMTPNGFQPSFAFSSRTDGSRKDLSLDVGWTRDGEDDLLSFRFAGNALPAEWPAEAEADGEVFLFGGLYPNFSFRYTLQSDSSGRVLIGIKKYSGEKDAGDTMLTAEGTFLPKEDTVPKYTQEDMDACVDILRVNDVSLAAFKENIMETAAMGLIRFLVGIPASACQSLLDDLTDLGILDMLLPG